MLIEAAHIEAAQSCNGIPVSYFLPLLLYQLIEAAQTLIIRLKTVNHVQTGRLFE
jgi:hypothetical protein